MGNYCKNCSFNENNKNTMVMISENEQLKNDGLVNITNNKLSSEAENKTKNGIEEKKFENKYLSDFEILEKNLNGYTGQNAKSNYKKEKNKIVTDLLKRKTNEFKKTEINIVILGDSEVGKSSFAIQFVKNKFEQFHVVTIGTEHAKTCINFNDTRYTLNFIITSGVSLYKSDYSSFFEIADFFLIFFDVTNLTSFSNIPNTVKEIQNYLFKYKNDASNVIVVGNKCELKNRAISNDEAKNFCSKVSMKYYEISVKSKINLQALIEDILCTYHNF